MWSQTGKSHHARKVFSLQLIRRTAAVWKQLFRTAVTALSCCKSTLRLNTRYSLRNIFLEQKRAQVHSIAVTKALDFLANRRQVSNPILSNRSVPLQTCSVIQSMEITMNSLEDLESSIKHEIERYVGKHWNSVGTACYLSAIGSYIRQEVPDSRSVLKEGLREFLRQSPVVRVVQYPGISEKIGAIPLTVELPDDIAKLFEEVEPTVKPIHYPMYRQEFWDAFIRPIIKGRRVVIVSADNLVTVSDGTVDETEGAAYEISSDDLVGSIRGSIRDKVLATHEAIESWLTTQKIDRTPFLQTSYQQLDNRAGKRIAQFLKSFDGLSSEDMARIQVPLDILQKLAKLK